MRKIREKSVQPVVLTLECFCSRDDVLSDPGFVSGDSVVVFRQFVLAIPEMFGQLIMFMFFFDFHQ